MHRESLEFLQKWLVSKRRKPLVIRGARQVGKTWLVRHFAQSEGKQLVEINFEKTPEIAELFDSNNPHVIIRKIEQQLEIKIDPSTSLLFLDEIQEKPELYAKLRWFYEDMPSLPVITAGSLLEFILEEYVMSMPVGRISFLFLEPLSFIEFLHAHKRESLIELIRNYTWDNTIPMIMHTELMRLFKEYVFIGGLPEAVFHWVQDQSLNTVKDVHRDLLGTYRNDFNKYKSTIKPALLNEVLDAVPSMLGKKFVYSHVESDAPTSKIKEALSLLCMARISHKVRCSRANGVPLGAEINNLFSKVILLDVGLCSAMLDLKYNTLEDIQELNLINKGGIAEQVVGQLLRAAEPFNLEPKLYYWLRAERGSDAEIDYIVQHHTTILPIEVKAGSSGSLESLHLFMKLKGLTKAARICSRPPEINDISIKDSDGNDITYQLRSIPFYLVSELRRLLD